MPINRAVDNEQLVSGAHHVCTVLRVIDEYVPVSRMVDILVRAGLRWFRNAPFNDFLGVRRGLQKLNYGVDIVPALLLDKIYRDNLTVSSGYCVDQGEVDIVLANLRGAIAGQEHN